MPTTRRQRLQREYTQQPSTFSYRGSRSDEMLNTGRQMQRQELKKASRRVGNFWLQRFGALVLLIVSIVCTINVLSLSHDPKIIVLASSAGSPKSVQPASIYQQTANRVLASSVWNGNKITVDTARVSQQLEHSFPEIAALSVTLPLLSHRPLIYIQPAEPAAIFTAVNGSFVLDRRGKVLVSGTSASLSGLELPTVTDQSGLRVARNQQVLTSSEVAFIQTVSAELAARQVNITSYTLPPGASELDAHINAQPYFVKFNLETNDAQQQAGAFLAVQANLRSQNITPAKYIDVRVDGRAYYQ